MGEGTDPSTPGILSRLNSHGDKMLEAGVTDDSIAVDDEGCPRPGGPLGSPGNAFADAVDAAADPTGDAVTRANWIDPDNWPATVDWTEPGSSNPSPFQRPAEFPLLTLRRGVTDSRVLETWIAGESDERAVSILLLDREGREVLGLDCRWAVPVRWLGPELRGDRPGAAMDSIEVAHAGITPIEG